MTVGTRGVVPNRSHYQSGEFLQEYTVLRNMIHESSVFGYLLAQDTQSSFDKFSSRADDCVVQESPSAPCALLHPVSLAST